ncbi:PhzF family phenazine biosynthesis protein [Fodinicurvata sediminis]|uniref:PhzF family phenazine biosynthesis protein n=1 Tax=Fodinicurvata sediminis TaxID=1121832 RepID=UPI0003B5AF20|nr:PhzF family phenazine biosynthesis protein [Fodinicurvata sediminis]
MTQRRFIQCDVFTAVPTKGNGLAVVLDADGLSDRAMQDFAAWTNLAETSFLLPPEDSAADYRLRIFTPDRELPFAGHPTLGSCAAWLHAEGVPIQEGLVRQECGVGLVEIDLTGATPAFAAPPTAVKALPEGRQSALVRALQLLPDRVVRSAWLNNGPDWNVLELESADDVLAVEPAGLRAAGLHDVGLIGPQSKGSETDYEVRLLAPPTAMSEDPITGSLNAAIAQWMAAEGRLPGPVTVRQGTRLGREGRVTITPSTKEAGRILIGGETQILIEGTLEL